MKLQIVSLLLCCMTGAVIGESQDLAQFRGPDRNGIFPGTGLLEAWPESGPPLLWSREGLDKGYASVSVTDQAIYLAGLDGGDEYLTVLDLQGNLQWRLKYGRGATGSYPEARSTPTVAGDRIYLISGRGQVVCIDGREQKIVWSVEGLEKFKGETWVWEVAESPLLVGNKVIYTPGGKLTSIVALDRDTGETVWQSESLGVPSAFVSPISIELGKRTIIATVLTEYLIGVDAKDGSTLWKVKYADIDPPTFHEYAPKNNCVTPLYHDGHLFITSGYDHVGVMFKLINDGTGIEQVWINKDLDNHHGQVVRVGSYIYGSNWIDNRNGNWCCVDWKTGQTMYEKEWQTKGSISAADGMLYCYDEKQGNLALVKATPKDFAIVSSFQVTAGSGPHWSQPVIHNGVLYLRHGDAVMAYKLTAG